MSAAAIDRSELPGLQEAALLADQVIHDLRRGRAVLASSGSADVPTLRLMARRDLGASLSETLASALAVSAEFRRPKGGMSAAAIESDNTGERLIKTQLPDGTELTIRMHDDFAPGIDAGSSFGRSTAGAQLTAPADTPAFSQYRNAQGASPDAPKIGLLTSARWMLDDAARAVGDLAFYPFPNPFAKPIPETARGKQVSAQIDSLIAQSQALEGQYKAGRLSVAEYQGARNRLSQTLSEAIVQCPEVAALKPQLREGAQSQLAPPHLFELVNRLSPEGRSELTGAIMAYETPPALKGDVIGAIKDALGERPKYSASMVQEPESAPAAQAEVANDEDDGPRMGF